MSDTVPAEDTPTDEVTEPPVGWKIRLRRIVVRYFLMYVVVVVVLAFFQRYLLYHPTKVADLSAASMAGVDGPIRDIKTETEDGLQLHGWHFPAAGSAERPLVLFFSGNAANRKNRITDCGMFAELGADVFIFDYRGYGDNPGSPSEEGLAADARAVWKYATQTKKVPSERIIIFGESLGGGVATALAAEVCANGTPPAALIVRSTFSSMVDAASSHYPWLPVSLVLIDRFPSEDRIADLTCPYCHVHGTEDRVVPIELGRKLFDAAPEQSANGIDKRFVELRELGHNNVSGQPEFRDAIQEFLAVIR